ncbi:MAG TPA: MBL fold metallo-hydrolase, partial [Balneolaceae bacterium]|nr:MBL fold metallo-hydrolase [Balneolaceae bacterium]
MLRNFIFVVLVSLLTFSLGFAQLNNDPDRIETEQGDLVIHPVLHGTVIFEWNGQTVYMDPWG